MVKDNSHKERIEELREQDNKLQRQTSGTNWELEGLADKILAEGRANVTKHSELRDYLSPSQLNLRWSREVYANQGFPEQHYYSGMYGRAYNPNTRGQTSSKATPSTIDEIDHDG